MTLGGWIFMLTSWGLVAGATIWCVIKLMRNNQSYEETDNTKSSPMK